MAGKNNVNQTGGNSKNTKKIIIIAAVCAALFLAGLASGLLAPSIKEKFDNIPGDKFNFQIYIILCNCN